MSIPGLPDGSPKRDAEIQSAGSGRYAHVDAMRAFAVMLVVVAHAGLGDVVPGGSGVTIFFAISGFIITHLVIKERRLTSGFDIKAFYLRRLMKIMPPLLVIVIVPTLVYSVNHPVRWSDVAAQIFFVFNWIYMEGGYQVLPGSGVVWSLAIEEQFYIAFAFFWLLAVRSRRSMELLVSMALLAVTFSVAMRFHIAISDFSHSRIYYGSDTRIDGIAIGVLTAVANHGLSGRPADHFWRRLFGHDVIVFVAIGGYLFSLLYRDEFFRETTRYTLQAVCAALMILYGMLQTGSALRRRLQRVFELRAVQVIGLASYSIYLIHFPIDYLFDGLVQGWPKPLAIAFLVLAGVVGGVLVWQFVEKPVEALKHKMAQRRGAVGAVV